ncbi:MAG: hypothetical protein FJ291_15570 [Planctomycetes bacterium]|nr:hypothetical protein [Planctomycetota bacterium]
MTAELWLPALGFIVAAAGVHAAAGQAALPGKVGNYRGYERRDFVVDGCQTIVVVPKQTAAGKPWVWRAEFFGAFPQIDLALLAKKGMGHHPHGLDDPAPAVEFILEHTRRGE